MNRLKNIIAQFKGKKLLVVGDVILDQYIQGSVSRISPEAPVPIVLEEKSFFTPGGAANVAHNLRGLGAQVALVGCLGKDPQGRIIQKHLRKKRIDIQGMCVEAGLPTICKTRVIAQHQQVVRIDREKIRPPEHRAAVEKIIKFVGRTIKNYDAVILSDYGKGLITAELVNAIRDMALAKNKILTVDPKVEHFSYYTDVTAITPNLKETENAIRNIKITSPAARRLKIHVDRLLTDAEITQAGTELLRFLGLESLLITLGEHGMRLFEKGRPPVSIKTQAREVFDVSGAGDTVIATFTLSLAAGASKREAADLANAAAGIVVGKMGAIAITKAELTAAVGG